MKLDHLIILVLITFNLSALCQTIGDSNNDEIFKQVIQLKEFIIAEKRVDSLNRLSKYPLKLTVDIAAKSFFEEDSAKQITLAFIKEGTLFDDKILYTIKYDKMLKKIISIQSNQKRP